MEKIRIDAGTVQETLLIPLYGRKRAMDQYPEDDTAELCSWSENIVSAVSNGYLSGYRPLDKRYGFITNLVFRHLDQSGMCQVIEMDFAR